MGVSPGYGAVRDRVQARWRKRHETPYFNEVFFAGEDEEIQEEKATEDPKQDYWVFDAHRQKLQRHHVVWRRNLFNPSSAEQSPIPLRALRPQRNTVLVNAKGETQENERPMVPVFETRGTFRMVERDHRV